METVTGTITVVKADGLGWLIIAETIDEGRYRMVRELCGEEPVTEEILRFIDRLPRRLAKIEGAEVELKRRADNRQVSPKRAARQAAREVAEARDPGRFRPTKAMQFKSDELEMSKAIEQHFRELEVTVWVRYGKKKASFITGPEANQAVAELTTLAADPASNRAVITLLARHYRTSPEKVELLHGYASPKKTFKVITRNYLL